MRKPGANSEPRPPSSAKLVRHAVLTVLVLAVLAAVGGAAVLFFGIYNISALQQHTAPVFHLLDTGMKYSVRQRAAEIVPPPLGGPELIARGLHHYRQRCLQCHGAPGVARHDIGKGMTPVPANLVHTARHWSAAEVFWVIKHGVKMSGMPGWKHVLSDEDMWAITAFVMHLPELSPVDYRNMAERGEPVPEARPGHDQSAPLPPDAVRGRKALHAYACTACHSIPGVVGQATHVGPPLGGIGNRRYIAGVLPNTFGNLVRWIRNPTEVDPLTAMPDLDVSEQDARDIARYLYTLDRKDEPRPSNRTGETDR